MIASAVRVAASVLVVSSGVLLAQTRPPATAPYRISRPVISSLSINHGAEMISGGGVTLTASFVKEAPAPTEIRVSENPTFSEPWATWRTFTQSAEGDLKFPGSSGFQTYPGPINWFNELTQVTKTVYVQARSGDAVSDVKSDTILVAKDFAIDPDYAVGEAKANTYGFQQTGGGCEMVSENRLHIFSLRAPTFECTFKIFAFKQLSRGWTFVAFDTTKVTGLKLDIQKYPSAGGTGLETIIVMGPRSAFNITKVRLRGPVTGRWQNAFLASLR